jgi:hypoxanthine phosphoribosyltransferase
MLRKNAIKKMIKKIILDFKLLIKNFIYRDFIYKYFKKPIQERKQKFMAEKAKKELIKSFEKSFGVKHKAVLRINEIVNTDYSLSDKNKYLKEKLKEGAKAMVGYTNKSPMFYEPDIVNIHNDFNEFNEEPTLRDIIKEETSLADKIFREKEYQFYRENYSKEKKLNLLKKRFGI